MSVDLSLKELHLFDAPIERDVAALAAMERIFLRLFVAGFGESVEIRRERNARKFAAEIGDVMLAILRGMQHGIDVVENVPLADFPFAAVRLEFLQRTIRHALPPIAPVFGEGAEGEVLDGE